MDIDKLTVILSKQERPKKILIEYCPHILLPLYAVLRTRRALLSLLWCGLPELEHVCVQVKPILWGCDIMFRGSYNQLWLK